MNYYLRMFFLVYLLLCSSCSMLDLLDKDVQKESRYHSGGDTRFADNPQYQADGTPYYPIEHYIPARNNKREGLKREDLDIDEGLLQFDNPEEWEVLLVESDQYDKYQKETMAIKDLEEKKNEIIDRYKKGGSEELNDDEKKIIEEEKAQIESLPSSAYERIANEEELIEAENQDYGDMSESYDLNED